MESKTYPLPASSGGDVGKHLHGFLRLSASRIMEVYPNLGPYLEKVLGIPQIRQELIAAEEKEKSMKGRPKGKKARMAAKQKEAKVSQAESDSDDVETVTTMGLSLSFTDKPENWKHSQHWEAAAIIHTAQYCRVKVLYPELKKRGIDEKKVNWLELSNSPDFNDNFKYCAKLAHHRNRIVQSDEIFKFLPADVDTALTSLRSMGVKLDRTALEFVLNFAPGTRISETQEPENTTLSKATARSKLLILGLHRACQYIQKAGIDIPAVSNLCAQIKKLRHAHAHPTNFNENEIKALIAELKSIII